jgi:hypothetical protein
MAAKGDEVAGVGARRAGEARDSVALSTARSGREANAELQKGFVSSG